MKDSAAGQSPLAASSQASTEHTNVCTAQRRAEPSKRHEKGSVYRTPRTQKCMEAGLPGTRRWWLSAQPLAGPLPRSSIKPSALEAALPSCTGNPDIEGPLAAVGRRWPLPAWLPSVRLTARPAVAGVKVDQVHSHCSTGTLCRAGDPKT